MYNKDQITEFYYFDESVKFCYSYRKYNNSTDDSFLQNYPIYKDDSFCKNKLYNDKSKIISYRGNMYINCSVKNKHVKLFFESENDSFSVFKYLNTYYVKLKNKWINKINKKFKYYDKEFIGSHIRTFGFFKDLKDRSVLHSFNITEVFEIFYVFITDHSLPFYLASDSLILKKFIYTELSKNNIFINTDLILTDHSYAYNNRIEINTVLDLEILSKALFLVLTSRSTYSTTIYLKNINCDLQKCKFISPFIRKYDLLQKNKN